MAKTKSLWKGSRKIEVREDTSEVTIRAANAEADHAGR